MHIGALLLAAGFSSRFGGVKQLATLDSGARVFDQTYARLQVAVPEIVVLTRPELSSELDAKARRVEVFTEAERGMGATLAYGMQFIANRRLVQIGLPEQFQGVSNPFPWMSEIMDLRKEKNFFETRVIEYQTGGALTWD